MPIWSAWKSFPSQHGIIRYGEWSSWMAETPAGAARRPLQRPVLIRPHMAVIDRSQNSWHLPSASSGHNDPGRSLRFRQDSGNNTLANSGEIRSFESHPSLMTPWLSYVPSRDFNIVALRYDLMTFVDLQLNTYLSNSMRILIAWLADWRKNDVLLIFSLILVSPWGKYCISRTW